MLETSREKPFFSVEEVRIHPRHYLRPCFKLSAVKSGRMFLVCTRRILAKSLKQDCYSYWPMTKRRRSHRPALLYCIHGAWDRSGGIRYLCMSLTLRPELTGTIIAPNAPDTAEVKVISARRGMTLVSMEALGMWQRVGFLADVIGCFKKHGISVDLVSTSETNVTASFDPAAGMVPRTTVDALLTDLRAHCEATLIERCAAVSLVGRHIRAILHQLVQP